MGFTSFGTLFIFLIDDIQSFKDQFRVIDIDQFGVIVDHVSQSAGGDDFHVFMPGFPFELFDGVFHASQKLVEDPRLHFRLGVSGQYGFRLLDLDFRQLGGLGPKGIGAGFDPDADDTGFKDAVFIDIIIGGGGSEVDHQQRASVFIKGTGTIGDPVGPDTFRVFQLNADSAFDPRLNDDGFNSEEFDDPADHRVHDFGNHAGDDDIFDLFQLNVGGVGECL